MKTSNLKKQYEVIVDKYIKVFCKKQDFYLEYWVADEIGGTACFGDIYYFSFDDIRYDIDTEQPAELILNWINDSVQYEDLKINYKSYSNGLRFEYLKKRTEDKHGKSNSNT